MEEYDVREQHELLKLVLKRRTMLLLEMMEFQEKFNKDKTTIATRHKGYHGQSPNDGGENGNEKEGSYCYEDYDGTVYLDATDNDRKGGSTMLGPGNSYSYKDYDGNIYSDSTDFNVIEEKFKSMMFESGEAYRDMIFESMIEDPNCKVDFTKPIKNEDFYEDKHEQMVLGNHYKLLKIWEGNPKEGSPVKVSNDPRLHEFYINQFKKNLFGKKTVLEMDKKPAAKTKKRDRDSNEGGGKTPK